MNLLLIVIIFLVTLYICIIIRRHFEHFSQDDDHLIAHFGGVPNNSQIWSGMIKNPPYV
jgi:hypothetical protein